jgi:hypothetical protein
MAQINKPSEYFNTKLYTGNNGATQSVTGVGFQPDFVWIKNRTDARNHVLTDIVRGATKTLFSQTTLAEVTNPTDGYLSSFGSDGFSVSQGSIGNENVCATDNYVSWNWLASNTTTSNTDGSITSTVSANTTSGFSIVSYTGTGANATVGHGLGSAPKMVIFKNRDNGTQEWDTYHTGLTNATYFIQLNSGNAQNNTNGALRFNSTAPSTNYFSVGTATTTNESGSAMIAYCFAEKKGFSKFGSYTGNGNADGTFVYTGFKPAMVIVKRTNAISNWTVTDNKRNAYNGLFSTLFPNLSNAQETTSARSMDILSNGFKFRGSDEGNESGATQIYMAFAEHPLVGTNDIPTTAR